MNYLIEARRNALAAEFVLGTMRGGARRRYQQLMMQHQIIRETTWVWEQYINVLGHKLKPVPPSPQVWEKVSQKIGFNSSSGLNGQKSSNDSENDQLDAKVITDNVVQLPVRSTRFWQGMTGLATAAMFVLAVILVRFESADVAPMQYAVVQSAQAEALWLIEVSDTNIKVKATHKLAPQATNDYELWFVAADGRAPVSLGVLPKNGELSLTKPDLFGRVELAALAVSLEPLGGSPTGAPTQVLYTTELVTL